MHDETMLDLENGQLKESAIDLESAKILLEPYLAQTFQDDEIDKFAGEVAALKHQNVREAVEEMMTGTQQYLEAVNTPIAYQNGLPTNLNRYVEKLDKIAEGIESCWDLFSPESRKFFVRVADHFCEVGENKFKGWRGLFARLKLLFPSIKMRANLFAKYRNSFSIVPTAVDRAVELRKKKGTSELSNISISLSKRAREIWRLRQSLLPYMTNLGRDREDQIRKNQAAMAWAKARMKEIEEKHGWGTAEK